jgi:Ca2+-binding RTX toxin-like protein
MASIIGTSGNDVLTGTDESDQLYGLAGDDQLIAVGDGDTLIGGAGADQFVVDEPGHSVTLSYAGSNEAITAVYGGYWSPYFLLEGGDAQGDSLPLPDHGTALNIIGTDHDDIFRGYWTEAEGGAGADHYSVEYNSAVSYAHSPEGVLVDLNTGETSGGDAEGDVITVVYNSPGLIGSAFDDYLVARAKGNADLVGGGGNDTLIGGNGHDLIQAGDGNDIIRAGAGNDNLSGGSGADLIDGGEGDRDTASYSNDNAQTGVNVDLGAGIGWGGDAEGDVLIGIEVLQGSFQDDLLIGDAGDNELRGRSGSDVLIGGAGNDRLEGEASYDEISGDDSLFGGEGDDALRGGGGNDILIGGAGDDGFNGGEGADIIDGGDGNDLISYGYGRVDDPAVYVNIATNESYGGEAEGDIIRNIENVYGGSGDDVLIGEEGRNVLYGGQGDDLLQGSGGHDLLIGGSGADIIEGGDGNDYLVGGYMSSDYLDQSDSFVWNVYEGGAERDRIVDFEAGARGDHIVLGSDFQDKAGIHDFQDFIDHARQNDTGVYVDFADGRHYGYGVQIDGINISHLTFANVVFDEPDSGTESVGFGDDLV